MTFEQHKLIVKDDLCTALQIAPHEYDEWWDKALAEADAQYGGNSVEIQSAERQVPR